MKSRGVLQRAKAIYTNVYKQTVLPLVEYVSFMMCLNNKKDTEKLQRLQNRSLRLCYDINVPTDMSTARLHENARIDRLSDRRNMALLCIMFDLRQSEMYKKQEVRATRATEGYIFDLVIPHTGLYNKSPYYVGANMWNRLPVNIRNMNKKEHFKREIRGCLNLF